MKSENINSFFPFKILCKWMCVQDFNLVGSSKILLINRELGKTLYIQTRNKLPCSY